MSSHELALRDPAQRNPLQSESSQHVPSQQVSSQHESPQHVPSQHESSQHVSSQHVSSQHEASPRESVWKLRDVRFRHAGAGSDTLQGISLEIASNAITALLGPNGTGKSTLLQLLLGVLRPDAGELLFKSRAISLYTRKALALGIGVVPQDEVDPMFSVRDIVAMGRYPHLGPWQRERLEDERAIDRAMERADVAKFATRWVSTLSGGERQRVRVARALAQEARVLVLDEPTTYLDIRHEMTTFELLHTLRSEGVTVVLATHNLNLAARYADNLVMMHEGQIVATGTPTEVLTSERVGAVYDWPVAIVPHANGAPQVVPSSLVVA